MVRGITIMRLRTPVFYENYNTAEKYLEAEKIYMAFITLSYEARAT
jgi:hypothetical protein